MANIGTITLPLLEIEATSYRVEVEHLALALRLSNLAASQYCRYSFDSMAKFGSVYLGAGEEGLFTLEDADTDDGVEIDSIVELATTDLDISHQKRIRALHVGYETSGNLKLTLSNDEDNEREYTLVPINVDKKQHGNKVKVDRNGKGRYWKVKVENKEGCDFSINMVEAIVTILARKSSGS